VGLDVVIGDPGLAVGRLHRAFADPEQAGGESLDLVTRGSKQITGYGRQPLDFEMGDTELSTSWAVGEEEGVQKRKGFACACAVKVEFLDLVQSVVNSTTL
jgi:hypothetical protein